MHTPIFFGGLIIGYYRDTITTILSKIPLLPRIVDCLLILVGVILLYLYATEYALAPELGAQFGDFAIREYQMPIINLAEGCA